MSRTRRPSRPVATVERGDLARAPSRKPTAPSIATQRAARAGCPQAGAQPLGVEARTLGYDQRVILRMCRRAYGNGDRVERQPRATNQLATPCSGRSSYSWANMNGGVARGRGCRHRRSVRRAPATLALDGTGQHDAQEADRAPQRLAQRGAPKRCAAEKSKLPGASAPATGRRPVVERLHAGCRAGRSASTGMRVSVSARSIPARASSGDGSSPRPQSGQHAGDETRNDHVARPTTETGADRIGHR